MSDPPANYPAYPEARSASVRDLRSDIAETLSRVQYGGERTIIHRRGKPAAALVSMRDLELLQKVEDRYWAEEGLRAEAESDARGERDIPFEEVERHLDNQAQRKAG